MWLLSLDGLKLPGSAAARSRPTDGFSAMTRVLLTEVSLATSSPGAVSVRARPRPHRPVCLAERPGHDRIRHPEADALPAPHGGPEDRGDHAPAAVDHGATRVAGAHKTPQRCDLAQDRPAPIGVLRAHRARFAEPRRAHVERAVLG